MLSAMVLLHHLQKGQITILASSAKPPSRHRWPAPVARVAPEMMESLAHANAAIPNRAIPANLVTQVAGAGTVHRVPGGITVCHRLRPKLLSLKASQVQRGGRVTAKTARNSNCSGGIRYRAVLRLAGPFAEQYWISAAMGGGNENFVPAAH